MPNAAQRILEEREAALREAVEELYRVFRNYRLLGEIPKDPCFPGACDETPLRAKPLRELSLKQLDRYLWKAVTTWGDSTHFRHFLPRLLELFAFPERTGIYGMYDFIDDWLLLGKIEYAGLRQWPERERDAVTAFFRAYFLHLLAFPAPQSDESDGYFSSSIPSITYPESWLSSLLEIGEPLDVYLDLWRADMRHPLTAYQAIGHLALAIYHSRPPTPPQLRNSRRDGDEPLDKDRAQQAFHDWLYSEEIRSLLEKSFFRFEQRPIAPLLSQAHARVENYRKRWSN